jgi:carbon-monoxide dehydrogenase small subunit
MTRISVTVDGVRYDDDVEPRTLLVHHLRDKLGKIGTVVGCDTSNCGACTILMTDADGNAHGVKSCSVLAVQADGREVTTIEGLSEPGGKLHPIQAAYLENGGTQCGFCTPGMIMAAVDLLSENPDPTDTEIREGLEGNLCRCTGYQNIVRAVRSAAEEIRAGASAEPADATVAAGEAGTPDAGLPKESAPEDVIPVPAP